MTKGQVTRGRRLHALVGTCLVAALPALALASPPSDAAVGQIDAILNFCAKSVPELQKNTGLYRAAWIGNAAPGARNSKAYKDAYDLVSEALEKGNRGQEITACVKGLDNKHREREEREPHLHGRR